MTETQSKKTSIGAIDPALHKRVKQYALDNGTSVRVVAESALKLYIQPVRKERAK